MCFGGGSNKDAKKALAWQKQQAADAAKKEAERQARLKEGTGLINNLFDGAPVMGERQATFDWTKFNEAANSAASGSPMSFLSGSGGGMFGDLFSAIGNSSNGDAFSGVTLPAGFKLQTRQVTDGNQFPIPFPFAGGGSRQQSTPRTVYELVGPDGRVYKPGDVLNYNEQYDTGARTGGFGDDFYNKYRQATLDYYTPELEKQYSKARSTLNFDHARAGTLQSSMAGDNLADLVYQNTMNEALVRSKADSATAQLKNSVAAQKSAALGQLYATEDPSIAANTATNSVRTLQNTTPEFSPMGELFKNAVVGATGYAGAYNDYSNWGTPPGSASSGRVIG